MSLLNDVSHHQCFHNFPLVLNFSCHSICKVVTEVIKVFVIDRLLNAILFATSYELNTYLDPMSQTFGSLQLCKLCNSLQHCRESIVMKHPSCAQSLREQLHNRQSHGGNGTSRGIFQEHNCTRERAPSPPCVYTTRTQDISVQRVSEL